MRMAADGRHSSSWGLPVYSGGMTTDFEFAASNRQAARRAALFITIATLVLIAGFVLVGDLVRGLAVAGLTLAGWGAVQLIGIAYLRTSPKHPAVGLSVVAGISTVLAVLAVTGLTAGPRDAVIVAGAWLACGAAAEYVRGQQWRRALTDTGTSGNIVRTLAVYTGYDGTPLLSFLLGGLLVGVWAGLIDTLPWVAPFAALVHVAVALGLSANPQHR